MKQRVAAIIPARYNSSRFPGKLLVPVRGKTVLQRTFESAKKSSSLDALFVATDDARIYDHSIGFGAQAVMTSSRCRNGTERLVEAISQSSELSQYDIYVNIQGDEPCIPASTIERVVEALKNSQDVMATAIMPITNMEEFHSSGVVKCVTDCAGRALYFSRSPIPHGKENMQAAYKHIGIYAYRKEFLLAYATMSNTPLQEREDLEQLKVLEHGFSIRTVVVHEHSISVDFPEDIEKMEQLLCIQNLSS